MKYGLLDVLLLTTLLAFGNDVIAMVKPLDCVESEITSKQIRTLTSRKTILEECEIEKAIALASSLTIESETTFVLHHAIARGDIDKVKALLDEGIDKEKQNTSGFRPLHYAILKGHTPLVELLVANRADPEAEAVGYRPLHLAAFVGNVDILRILLQAGVLRDPIHKESGYIPLHTAVKNGHSSIVNLLLTPLEPFSIQNASGLSKIGAAWKSWFPKIANINARSNNDYTPLHIAAVMGNSVIIKILLGRGALIESPDDKGFRPVHHAIRNGELAAAALLMEHGADIEAQDNEYQHNALYLAVRYGYLEIAQLLLQKKPHLREWSGQGATPLQCAAYYGNLAMIELLLKHGADINERGRYNYTALHVASERSCSAARLLLEYGAAFATKHPRGIEPLTAAVLAGNVSLVLLFIEKGADYQIRTEGSSLLHYAAEYGHTSLVELFIKHGLAVDARNSEKFSPLHLAVLNRRGDCIQILRAHGARVDARALELARQRGFSEISQVLLEHRFSVQ